MLNLAYNYLKERNLTPMPQSVYYVKYHSQVVLKEVEALTICKAGR